PLCTSLSNRSTEACRALDSHSPLPVRNYDVKKQKLVDKYTIRVEKMVQDNNGILAFDNWCHIYSSPHLSTERDTAYIKANFAVVGVSQYQFLIRPVFAWRWVDQ